MTPAVPAKIHPLLRMPVYRALRQINRIHPGGLGRKKIAGIARGFLPKGVVARRARVGNGFLMTLALDEYVDSAIFFHAFEYSTCRAISRILKPGDTFIDVGAHIGFFTLMGARLVGKTGQVTALEPNPAVRERLLRNLEHNGWVNKVRVWEWGLSDTNATVELCIPANRSGGTGHASIRPQEDWISYTRHGIVVKRLDDIWPPEEEVDLIKLDIEGAELLALKGASEVIARSRPNVICEFNPNTAAAFGYTPMDLVEFFTKEIGDYGVNVLTSRRIVWNAPPTEAALCGPKVENWWFYPRDRATSQRRTASS